MRTITGRHIMKWGQRLGRLIMEWGQGFGRHIMEWGQESPGIVTSPPVKCLNLSIFGNDQFQRWSCETKTVDLNGRHFSCEYEMKWWMIMVIPWQGWLSTICSWPHVSDHGDSLTRMTQHNLFQTSCQWSVSTQTGGEGWLTHQAKGIIRIKSHWKCWLMNKAGKGIEHLLVFLASVIWNFITVQTRPGQRS